MDVFLDRYVWEINYPRIVIYAQKGFASMEELRYCPLLNSVVTIIGYRKVRINFCRQKSKNEEAQLWEENGKP